MALEVVQLPAFDDNYLYLCHCPQKNMTTAIDPGDANVINVALKKRGWKLDYIWNTHHHSDHTGGNLKLKRDWNCTVLGSSEDKSRIPGIDHFVESGQVLSLGDLSATVLSVPGHTRAHIAFYFSEDAAVFCGDTLFSLGCGRLFEGTPKQMWASLKILRSLPNDTKVYCAHEYTEANLNFCLSLDPDSDALAKFGASLKNKRATHQPSVPSTIEIEKKLNPFLRADDPTIATLLSMESSEPSEIFAEIRHRKDRF